MGTDVEGLVIEHEKFLFEEEKKYDDSITGEFDADSVDLSFIEPDKYYYTGMFFASNVQKQIRRSVDIITYMDARHSSGPDKGTIFGEFLQDANHHQIPRFLHILSMLKVREHSLNVWRRLLNSNLASIRI